ncbi:riboflavin kinase / FMN adenylyltransferase [Anaerosphaera aminiphila DSM 21120]|uniref:Riboflavin biosynthesis protein n=1 Tax=Anaerosphaera aminiphila DSM 21120 TaxID=1120995 RepID=A0A1M5NYZ2_9FIRM|nr:bifunctional riboflavin kinase/FAD synthetase [Anaerosphaera aminiphila]SHG94687.1 riboflavin kinase / FMN adenylyltransferase [Anaerosphaera aminiphila DSM 21120]
MEIITIDKNFVAKENTFIALGNFDGVHTAHKILLKKLVEEAKLNGYKSSILIFKSHTKNLIFKQEQRLLTSNEQKYKLLKEIGIDIIYELEFNKIVMTMDPDDFIKKLLLKHLKVKGIVVGFDYRFGHKASGNTELLKQRSLEENFKLFIINPVEKNGKIISSTSIRELIKNGQIKLANEFLGYNFTMNGVVINGKNLGSKMGFPTANIKTDVNYEIPKFGVYDTNIEINGKSYRAATNIGKNPTIENSGLRIEAFILDFNEDIYGKSVQLSLLDFIREEENFDNIDDLFAQIKLDVDYIKTRL